MSVYISIQMSSRKSMLVFSLVTPSCNYCWKMNILTKQHLLRKCTFPMQNIEISQKKNPINIDDLILQSSGNQSVFGFYCYKSCFTKIIISDLQKIRKQNLLQIVYFLLEMLLNKAQCQHITFRSCSQLRAGVISKWD